MDSALTTKSTIVTSNLSDNATFSIQLNGSTIDGNAGEGSASYAGLDRCLSLVLVVGLSFVLVLSSTGNATVLYIIGRHLKWRTATNAWVTILSLSDFMIAVACVPLSIASVVVGGGERSSFGGKAFVVSTFVSKFFGLLSAAMMTLLTLDRYQTVVRLTRVTFALDRTLAAIVLCAVVSLLLVLPWPVLVWRAETSAVYCGSLQWSLGYRVYDAVYVTVCYTGPVVCMVVCVSRLMRTIHRSGSDVCPHSMHVTQLRFIGEIQTAQTVIVMVIVFIVFRTPYAVLAYANALFSTSLSSSTTFATQLLWWTNGVFNPLIYVARNPNVGKILHLDRKSGYVSKEPAPTSNDHLPSSNRRDDETSTGNKSGVTSGTNVWLAGSDPSALGGGQEIQDLSYAAGAVVRRASLRSMSTPSVLNFVISRSKTRNSVSSVSTTLTNVTVI